MKYELVSLSVIIQGVKFKKEDSPELDDAKLNKRELEAAYKNGFIKPKGTKAKNPKEVKAQYLADQKKTAKVSEKKSADNSKSKKTE